MSRFRLFILLTVALLSAIPVCGASGVPGWETVKTEPNGSKSVIKEPDIEIMTAPACIIVTTGKQVEIKVFTILGRLVSSETLPPGMSQLSVGAHGVYIVKVGELTCKVAI